MQMSRDKKGRQTWTDLERTAFHIFSAFVSKGHGFKWLHWSAVLIKSRAICLSSRCSCNSKAMSKLKLMTQQRVFFPLLMCSGKEPLANL